MESSTYDWYTSRIASRGHTPAPLGLVCRSKGLSHRGLLGSVVQGPEILRFVLATPTERFNLAPEVCRGLWLKEPKRQSLLCRLPRLGENLQPKRAGPACQAL